MFWRKNKPIELDPLEFEAKVLEFREALLNEPTTQGAVDFLTGQPAHLRWPLNEGLKHLFNETPRELITEDEMRAVGFYLLSIYGD